MSINLYKNQIICGVDESGRGPIAGPVFAAAVILNPKKTIYGLKDSKKLTKNDLENLAMEIKEKSIAWSIAECSEKTIDKINILQASLLAMSKAISKLIIKPSIVLVDGLHCPKIKITSKNIIKGDQKIPEISAASILAKTSRDQALLMLHEKFPQYGFNKHKGYPTKLHIERLSIFGVTSIHRKTFKPVSRML